MLKERLEDLSIYYWLKNLFSESPFINIEDGYPENDIVLPTVSIDATMILATESEMGNRESIKYRTYVIDIFAQNKSQRDEIAYTIYNALDNKIPVYDYNVGFPPNVSPPEIDCYDIREKRLQIIRILPELVEKMYYRATVTFVAVLNSL